MPHPSRVGLRTPSKCRSRPPTAPTIWTSTSAVVAEDPDAGFFLVRRAQATAWLAPLPPALEVKDSAWTVSPGSGKFLVTETMSALSEPMTRMRGAMVGGGSDEVLMEEGSRGGEGK